MKHGSTAYGLRALSHLLIILLILTAGFAASISASQRLTRMYSQYHLMEMVDSRRQAIFASIQARCNAVIGCAEQLRDADGDIDTLLPGLPTAFASVSSALKVALIDVTGVGLNTHGEIADLSQGSLFQRARQSGGCALGVGMSPEDDRSVFVIVTPVYSDDAVRYYLAAAYDVIDMSQYLLEDHSTNGAAVILVDSHGNMVLSGSEQRDILHEISPDGSVNRAEADTVRSALLAGGSGHVLYRDHGENWYCAYMNLGINDWRITYRVLEMETGYVEQRVVWYFHALLGLCAVLVCWLCREMFMRDKKHAERQAQDEISLRALHECLRLLSENPGALVCDTDLRSGKTFMYGGFSSAFGRDPILTNFPMDAARGGSIAEEDAVRLRDALEYSKRGAERTQVDADVRRADGSFRRCRYHVRPLCDENGRPVRIIGLIVEIDHNDIESEAEQLVDYGTGLLRRRSGQEHMDAALATAPSTLILLDIDNSSSLGDKLGRDGLERVLTAVANVMRSVSGPNDILARLGGDEFAILAVGCTDEAVIRDRIIQLLAGLQSEGDERGVELSGSIGCAMSPKDGLSFDELYYKADTAQYIAKQSGKKRYLIYRES